MYIYIYVYIYIFLPVNAVFGIVKTYFLTNPSFRLMESEFLFNGNSILLFTALVLLAENIISSKIRFLKHRFH